MTNDSTGTPRALTIAGSDSGGGAGIQADLKTFAAFGVYGTSAITALTAQNTQSVLGVHAVPAEFVTMQIEAVVTDIGCDAVKTGMLATSTIVEVVIAAIESFDLPNLVVDPVMVAKSGDRLLDEDAVHAVRTGLLRMARVVTPNVPEAEVLSGMTVRTRADMLEAARRIVRLGAGAVVMKGGHLSDRAMYDVLLEGDEVTEFESARVPGRHTHGTGCTFASGVAAGLAHGLPLVDAVRGAREYVAGAIRTGVAVGQGHGPLDHFWDGAPGVQARRRD